MFLQAQLQASDYESGAHIHEGDGGGKEKFNGTAFMTTRDVA